MEQTQPLEHGSRDGDGPLRREAEPPSGAVAKDQRVQALHIRNLIQTQETPALVPVARYQ
jgi:hypothetical protein